MPMTDICDSLMTSHDDVELLLRDLARVSGTLSEIATVWRRARPYLPDLPLTLPLQLQDSARQLAAAIQARTDAGSLQPADVVLSLPEQLCALKENITCARTMTCGPGIPQIGDRRLWQSIDTALMRALATLT
jgi:hypothetical protein